MCERPLCDEHGPTCRECLGLEAEDEAAIEMAAAMELAPLDDVETSRITAPILGVPVVLASSFVIIGAVCGLIAGQTAFGLAGLILGATLMGYGYSEMDRWKYWAHRFGRKRAENRLRKAAQKEQKRSGPDEL